MEASTCSTVSSQGASPAAALQALRRDCAGWRHEQTVHVDRGSSRACTGPGGGRYTASEGSSGQCGPRGVEGTQPASEGSSRQRGPRGWKVHSVRGQLWTVRAPGVEGTQCQRAAWAVRALRVRSGSPLLWRGFQVPPRHGPGATGTVLGHRALPLVAPPLGGRWVKPEVLVHACTAALNLKTS